MALQITPLEKDLKRRGFCKARRLYLLDYKGLKVEFRRNRRSTGAACAPLCLVIWASATTHLESPLKPALTRMLVTIGRWASAEALRA